MRTLYQFPLSHYCEKSRWCLDHKYLEYVARNLPIGLHMPLVRFKTGGNTLPVLRDGSMWIADSTDIALYLEKLYPERPLLSRHAGERAQQLRLDEESQQLGVQVRLFAYGFLLTDSHVMDVMMGERMPPAMVKVLTPVVQKMVKYHYRVQPERVRRAGRSLNDTLNRFERDLLANGGRYLVGDRLSLADIAVASMTAPLLNPAGTPWELPADHVLPEEIQQQRDALLERPIGQYIMRLYDHERRARVDWRGE